MLDVRSRHQTRARAARGFEGKTMERVREIHTRSAIAFRLLIASEGWP
jgi:hypothetical protein